MTWKDENYEEGQPVAWDMGVAHGTGKIRGIAVYSQPVIGRLWIVEVDYAQGLDAEHYPYSCIVVPASGISKLQ